MSRIPTSVRVALAVLVGAASGAAAHVVPIPPSACRLDPVMLRSAVSGVESLAVSGDGADGMRLVYDANASVVRLCTTQAGDAATCAAVAARAFSLEGVSASVGFPMKASGTMTTAGDVEFRDVPVAVSADTQVDVPVTLTTGLVALDGQVIEGTPLKGFGAFKLRGVLDGAALPPAFGGRSLLLTATCAPRPIPDVDQFVPASRVGGLAGRIDQSELRLRGLVRVGPADTTGLGRGPLLLTVRIDDRTTQTAVFSNPAGARRRVTLTSDDGRTTLTVVRHGDAAMAFSVTIPSPALPTLPADEPAIVGVTIDTGRLLARGERLFKPAGGGGLRRR